MKYANLGSTDISVSTVAMGCWPIVGDATWGPQEEKEAISTIRAALDLGVTTFDTAEGYGAGYSEQLLGRALAASRDKAVILSKVSPSHLAAADLKAACERSLKNLHTDYIDLYQIHWPSRTVLLAETLTALEELRDEGKIRAIGVSNFAEMDLADVLALGRVEANQLPYSLLFRAIEYNLVAPCRDNAIGILCYCPLAQGLLTGKFATADDVPEGRARTRHFSKDRPQVRHGESGCEDETFAAIARIRTVSQQIKEPMGAVSLAWLLHQPGVTSVLAGARNVAQITDNARAADLELPPETLAELADATADLKTALGPNPDMWQSTPRMR